VNKPIVAHANTIINAPAARVCHALVTPDMIKTYMFGTNVTSDWKEGSRIVWQGEWQGKAYEDKGVILWLQPERVLEYSHFSPLAGLPDSPDNYHTVTIELSPSGAGTTVSLSQDNNPTEQAREHSERNWGMMLNGLKSVLEQ
jgi:uncharacterized protein YndB with AHSA1/START domain